LTTYSTNSLKGCGQKQQRDSGDVAIFFLQTRKPLFSPWRCKRKIRYTCTSLKSIQLDWRAHSLPDNLAKVDVLVEERLLYMPEILNHLSCYLFSQDVHEH